MENKISTLLVINTLLKRKRIKNLCNRSWVVFPDGICPRLRVQASMSMSVHAVSLKTQ